MEDTTQSSKLEMKHYVIRKYLRENLSQAKKYKTLEASK